MQTQPRRLGFRFPLDPSATSASDLGSWLEGLSPLDAGWVVIPAGAERAVPESFLRQLTSRGVEPIVHIQIPVGELRPSELNPLLYSYAHWGVRYAVVYDRPNMKSAWADGGWNRDGLVERFLDACLPVLQAQFAAGMAPMLPPLEPGGDYWDTAFLRSTLRGIARRGQRDLLEGLVMTAYANSGDRPMDWGAGGPERWPAARPYFTPEGSQDHIGFRVFEWYAAIAKEIIGKALPVVALTAGSANGDNPEVNRRIAQDLGDEARYAPLIAACFAEVPAIDKRDGWIQGETEVGTVPDPQGNPPVDKALPKELLTNKVLEHYLLLPKEDETAIPTWRRATAFALTHQPVVGFSAAEAAMAKQVTIAGGTDSISEEVEALLRSAGCDVQRVSLLPLRKSACQARGGGPAGAH
jgi:hypothetical protein